ncbi:MAG: hypothetical protein GY938_03930 [Ketobacter sp.]|nr:hypothetical protein [Ketobacter sp.]
MLSGATFSSSLATMGGLMLNLPTSLSKPEPPPGVTPLALLKELDLFLNARAVLTVDALLLKSIKLGLASP